MNSRHPLGLAMAIVIAGQSPASAAQGSASASATIAVSIEITPNCTVAAGPLAFGTVTAAEAPSQTATASIEVACGPGVPFTVQLDDGQNATNGTRRAIDPATGQTVAYEIYADAAHTQRWGGLETQAVAGETGADGTGSLTAYGQIGSAGEVAAGQFGDLVTVTTNF